MPGITKRKYVGESMKMSKKITQMLKKIMPTLKPGYKADDVLNAFKRYYPAEWNIIVERQKLYADKDAFLRSMGKKRRYKPQTPEAFFYSLPKVKHVLSKGYRKEHETDYDEERRLDYLSKYKAKRDCSIKQHNEKIVKEKNDIQKIDPGFIEALIYAYHKKGNSVNEKLEILREIQKYDCEKSNKFLWKINDSERNDEIRLQAFNYLQKTGHYVKLRKKFKGKRKAYMTEKPDFVGTPESLAERLKNTRSIQNRKHYDIFISHSYKDQNRVREIMRMANKAGLNCYIDWSADRDFLKRRMVSEYTKEVLKYRMEQSDKLLYISSEQSRKSKWVAFELDFFRDYVRRDIYMIVLDGEDSNKYRTITVDDLKNLKV